MRVFEAESGVELLSISTGRSEARASSFTPDGRELVFAIGESLRWHDAASGERRASLGVDAGGISRLLHSPDGTRLAAAASYLPLIDATRRDALVVLRRQPDALWQLGWSPDGTRLASTAGSRIALTDRVPLRERLHRRARALALHERFAELVAARLKAGARPAALADELRADASLTAEERAAALDALTLHCAPRR